MKLLLVSVLFAVAYSKVIILDRVRYELEWKRWKLKYVKIYNDPVKEAERKANFFDNLYQIEKHNENGGSNFRVGLNEFADLTGDEIVYYLTGYNIPNGSVEVNEVKINDSVIPTTVDWREKKAVTTMKNQGLCGSSWAFSATGSLEGQHFMKTGELVSLSEQNLVDCSGNAGNEGCKGGSMKGAFEYIKNNQGIDTEASYPYTAKVGSCSYSSMQSSVSISGYNVLAKGENNLQKAVATVGPISSAIDASLWTFHFYKDGVYDEATCSSTSLNHGVLTVGYGTAKKEGDYWIVKNSWGTSWGMNGYILMARNKNNKCGIASMASYPTV